MCLRITNVRIRAEVLKRSTQILRMFPQAFFLDLNLLMLLSTFLPVCHLLLEKTVLSILLTQVFIFNVKRASLFIYIRQVKKNDSATLILKDLNKKITIYKLI